MHHGTSWFPVCISGRGEVGKELKMEGLLLIILAICVTLMVVATVVYLLHYIGYFYKVRVSAGPSIVSELRVAYKFHTGNYSACGSHFLEISQLSEEAKTLGIYYDGPKEVGADSCRYIVGAILAEGTTQEPDSDLEKKFLEQNFKIVCLPKVDFSVKASHPFTTPLSAFLGAKKAYPALGKYIKDEKLCAHPFMELYHDDTIHYMVPLSKQADFYVEEVRDML